MCIHPRAIPHLSTGRQGGGGHDTGSQAPEAPPANLGLTELFSETRSISTQRNRSHFLLISFLGAICTRLQIVLCTVILAELQTIRKDFHKSTLWNLFLCILCENATHNAPLECYLLSFLPSWCDLSLLSIHRAYFSHISYVIMSSPCCTYVHVGL